MKKAPYLIRTRLAKEIVAEVALPARQTGKVAVLAGGLPGSPFYRERVDFLATQGYVVFAIRYRGTWESEGWFLKQSPKKDVKDVVDHIVQKRSFVDTFSRKKMKVRVYKIHLFGGSFGGAAVLLNSTHPKVDKVIAVAPVVDWNEGLGKAEPFEESVRFTEDGFGDAYRLQKKSDWQKLLQPHFYNPVTDTRYIDPEKCLVLHTKDDDIVTPESVKRFVDDNEIRHYFKPQGGHGGIAIQHRFIWRKIEAFLK